MINAIHTLIYAEDAAKARAFFRDILKLPHVDTDGGWLIFALPPAELGIHPVEGGAPTSGHHQLYLMCDDIEATVADLKRKGVEFTSPVKDVGWGILTSFKVPGAGDMHLYQPRHATPLTLRAGRTAPTRGHKPAPAKKAATTAKPSRAKKKTAGRASR